MDSKCLVEVAEVRGLKEAARRLADRGIVKGAVLALVRPLPLLTIKVLGTTIALDTSLASAIVVKVVGMPI